VLSAEALSTDDGQYLTENLLVRNPGWASAGRFLVEVRAPSTVRGYYQPLTMISLMVDDALGGRPDQLRPFHRTSLALHLLTTALVVVLLYRLFGHAPSACLLGLLFGVHPVTVEPIAWIAERKTLLAGSFALLALVLYVSFVQRGGRWRFAASLVAYALAMLAKPTAVPLPAGLLVLDFWPLRRLGKRALVEKLPFLALAVLFAVVTVLSQQARANLALPTERPPGEVTLTLLHNTVFYLATLVWPTSLSSHYPIPQPLALAHPMVLAGLLGTCLLVPALLLSLRWTRAPLAGWLFFMVMISPALGAIKFTYVIAADKHAYLPMVGLLLPLAAALRHVWPAAREGRAHAGPVALGAALLVLAALEIHATRRQLVTWQTSEAHYRAMLSLAPNAAILHHGLGEVLLDQQRYPEAIAELRQSLALEPRDLDARLTLAIARTRAGHVDEAIADYRAMLDASPQFAQAHNNLANLLLAQGRVDEAIAHFEQAVALDPAYATGHYNLANTLAQRGRLAQAIAHYRKALALHPRFTNAWANLGLTLAEAGQPDEALAALRTAADLEPRNPQPRLALGNLLSELGRYDEATSQLRRVLEIDPQNAQARELLDRTKSPAQR
jgi:tetratricopeptide (TPR) repeat protein